MLPIVVRLGCEPAIAAATSALPDDHAPITHILFQLGDYCPPGWLCPAFPRYPFDTGFVLFTFAGAAQTLVTVVVDDHGQIHVSTPTSPPS